MGRREDKVRDFSKYHLEHVCKTCGKVFVCNHPSTKYCESCREERKNRGRAGSNTRKNKFKPRVCQHCGNMYTPSASNQKYCIDCREIVTKMRDASYIKRKPIIFKDCLCCGGKYVPIRKDQKYCENCSEVCHNMEVYRMKAFNHYPHVCNRCGADVTVFTANVHHKDHNHRNNDIDNLEILCTVCHRAEHTVRDEKTGKIITNI